MSPNPTRRAAAAATSVTLIATGLTVGLGAGVAGAAECLPSSHYEKKNISTAWATYSYDKSVSATQVAGGTEVTYETVVSTQALISNPYLNTVVDYPPAGFGAPIKTTVPAGIWTPRIPSQCG
ncbi:hypothetical protein [Rhodococcus sp. WMMA185]|uniref:hypothetical protein n=1 Tax=Rhodococcus sp. WMMA185 TaxID=679318 RepID=UPI001E5ED3DC|nr:hypothetical protein [Rhodococcus sp. WMMA185]